MALKAAESSGLLLTGDARTSELSTPEGEEGIADEEDGNDGVAGLPFSPGMTLSKKGRRNRR
jgi:hypothetical protein